MGPPYLEVAEIPTKLAAKREVVKASFGGQSRG